MSTDKRNRFVKVAGNRVQTILDKVKLLGNCSSRNNYAYNEEDVRKMFEAIRKELKVAEQRFHSELEHSRKTKFKF